MRHVVGEFKDPGDVEVRSPLASIRSDHPILLFYDGYERRAREGRVRSFLAQGRPFARSVYRTLTRQQVNTGFYTAFVALVDALRRQGQEVRINDFAYARRHPETPIGVSGYASVLAEVDALPNPRVFGPGDFGMPPDTVSVARDRRFKTFTHPSRWYVDLYRPFCGDRLIPWFVGIDTVKLQSARNHPKDIDVLIYDKIRWERERHEPGILADARALLDSRGLRHETVRYGHHHRSQYLALLKRSKSLLFLCEHETQGLAYQEALAMDVPILAWDEGVLVDPHLQPFLPEGVTVSSVPYFDDRCGLRFRHETLQSQFTQFWGQLSSYRPRDYVVEKLSMAESARRYLAFYNSAAVA